MLRDSQGPAAKATLRAATAEAVAEKAFGLPYIVLQGEGVDAGSRHWFGAQSLHDLGLLLGHPIVLPESIPGGDPAVDAATVLSKL